MIINASYGRNNNSYVHVYTTSYNSNAYKFTFTKMKTITMPPMLEEAFNYNGYTYFVFESCGKTYRDNMDKQGITNIVIGRVCGFTSNFIYK